MWNICVELDKKHKEQTGKFIQRGDLQKQTKGCVEDLCAKNIYHVAHKYLYARDSMFRSIKAKHKNSHTVKLPYKQKRYFTTGWDYQSIKIDYNKGIIKLAKPMIYNECEQRMKKQKPIICKSKNIPKNIVEIELVYKGKYYLAIKYKENAEYLQIQSENEASIDLGEIHSIVSIDNNENALIITGRQIRSFKRFRNKELAKLKSRRSKCTKGSKKYIKYSKAIEKLKYKTDRKINDSTHKITKLYLGYCLMNNISAVYYGDLDSATRNTKNNNKGNTKVRQKLSQWNYGQLIRELENKLSRYGIKMIKVKEYYTSIKCPNCKSLNKPTSRNYTCKSCNYVQHRDIVGAINILNDNGNFDLTRYNNLKYLQIK